MSAQKVNPQNKRINRMIGLSDVENQRLDLLAKMLETSRSEAVRIAVEKQISQILQNHPKGTFQ